MTSPGVENTDVEKGLLELFRRELCRAVDDVAGSPDDDLDPIRTQKLVLAGIHEFGLEDYVTVQWYLDGDMLPNLPDGNDGVTIITNAGVENGPFPTREEVYTFYTDEFADSIATEETLSEVIKLDAFEWLKEYYEARDIPFGDVYQTNLEIYLKLRQFQQYLDPDHSRNELTGDVTPSTIAAEISDATMRMKQALIEYPLFQSLPPYMTEFDRIAEQIITQITEKNSEKNGLHELVSHLSRFYYKAIWQPIADRIGYYTVSAPTEQKVETTREYRTRNLRSAHSLFLDELSELRNKASEFDIRFETRVERLPQFAPEETGLEEVLSVDMDISKESEA